MINPEALARLWASVPQISSVRASADGGWAFWCWSGLTETDEVYAAPTDGSAPPERLTFGSDHFSIRDVSRDGGRLILAQSLHASEHDHLFLLDRGRAGRLTQLTPEQNDHYVYGGIFSRDGASVIFTANFDYDSGKPTEGGWVWRQDLATGERRVLAKSTTPFETGPTLSPDGRSLLWHRHEFAPEGTQLWVMGVDGSDAREVLNLSPSANARGHWLDDDRIAFVADAGAGDQAGILTLSTGAVRWLGGEPVFCPHDIVVGQNGLFAVITHESGNTRVLICNQATPSLRPMETPGARGSYLPWDALPDGAWLAEAYDASAPHALIRLAPDGTATPIATTAPISGLRHVRPSDYRWTSPDGTVCQGWLYRPDSPSKGLITYVHGGPTWHSEDWVNPKIGFWVQLGYTVLDPNYRGSTGFGRDYRDAVKVDGWGGREQADIRAGIEALVAEGLAIPGRIGIAGNSYGGFSSWFAITRHADLVNAAIPMCGMYRLDIDYKETEMPHGRAYSEEMMGGTPEELPEKYANASPGNFIDQIRGHLMIVHGLADSNVGPENTHTAVRELTAAGIPHEVLLFENEGHGINRRSNLATYLVRSAAFFERAFDGATP